MKWISVKDKLPKNEQKVLACVEIRLRDGTIKKRIVMAFYEDGKQIAGDSDWSWNDMDNFEYDEEYDDYFVPEGWYEYVIYTDESGVIGDFVTHWSELPEKPSDKE